MRNFRAERLSLLAPLLLAACAGGLAIGGGERTHPQVLVGAWVDSAKSSPSDSSFWVLSASGDDASRRVRRASPDSTPRIEGRHYGYWYLEGSLGDSATRAICFTKRPGRSAPTCIPFSLDSTTTGGRARRRLVVYGYQGRHSSGARVLLEAPAP